MYLRTTRQRRKHSPDAIYYQLAENYYHKAKRRSETRVIYTFGRADQIDPEALRRLAQSILRVANDERIDLPARKFPPDVGIDDIEQVYAYGVLYAAHALWEELGIGPLLREQMQQDGCEAPHDTALFAMTANRLARPGSKLACYEQWLADEGHWPGAQTLALEDLRVCAWLFPGNTADVTTINHLKDDLRGWRLNRCVFVGDRGMCSEANRQRLSRALGRYILAVPMRKVTEVPLEVLARAGRYRDVAHNLRVKEVYVGTGERRRRYLVCHNPDEAAREQAHPARLLEP